MNANCSVIPLEVELIRKITDKLIFKLRKNIVKNSIVNEFNNKSIDNWTCDEVEVLVFDKENIQEEIQNNFETYWQLGITQQQEKIELEQKKKEIEDLINNYKQLQINNDNNEKLTMAYMSIAEIYETILSVMG